MTFVLLLVIGGMVAGIMFLLLRGASVEAPVVPPHTAVPKVTPFVTVRLLSDSGRLLKTLEIPTALRRPTLRHRFKDGRIGVFQAIGRRDDGAWDYRRVQIEREH